MFRLDECLTQRIEQGYVKSNGTSNNNKILYIIRPRHYCESSKTEKMPDNFQTRNKVFRWVAALEPFQVILHLVHNNLVPTGQDDEIRVRLAKYIMANQLGAASMMKPEEFLPRRKRTTRTNNLKTKIEHKI